jgi:hypothetical protein
MVHCGGVALRVVSPQIAANSEGIARELNRQQNAQDAGGWRPHVTIQNKVAPKVARALLAALDQEFRPRPLAIHGLGLHRYLGGPWEDLAVYPLRGR